MRISLYAIVIPTLLIACFSFSAYWLATRQYDHGFAWLMAVGSLAAGVVGNALQVSSTDYRIRELEAKLERLSNKVWDKNIK